MGGAVTTLHYVALGVLIVWSAQCGGHYCFIWPVCAAPAHSTSLRRTHINGWPSKLGR